METWPTVELGTHSQTERASLDTLHLPARATRIYSDNHAARASGDARHDDLRASRPLPRRGVPASPRGRTSPLRLSPNGVADRRSTETACAQALGPKIIRTTQKTRAEYATSREVVRGGRVTEKSSARIADAEHGGDGGTARIGGTALGRSRERRSGMNAPGDSLFLGGAKWKVCFRS